MVDTTTPHKDGFASLHPGLLARKGKASPAASNLKIVPKTGGAPKKSDSPPEKTRASLRLNDRQRRLLRLVSAATDRSNQEILSVALDRHLMHIIGDELGECRCLRKMILAQGKDCSDEQLKSGSCPAR